MTDMELQPTLDRLRRALGPGKVLENEPMSRHTTFKVGGPADIFVLPGSTADVALTVRACREAGAPLFVLGNGSNLLVRDGGIRGVVMQLGGPFGAISVQGESLTAQGGALLSKVAAEAYRSGLAGMEFASGIPGSVGGAAAMNAGAYDGEMKDIVISVVAVTPGGETVRYDNQEMHYGYRHSRALEEKLIITEVTLGLKQGDMVTSKALLDDFTFRRSDKQPLEMPSAGSFFKRPPGHFAGKLISDAGLKGSSVGGAQVSPKHAGFIVNTGGATAADVLALAEHVQSRVRDLYGVELEREVRVVGEELR